MKMKSIFVAAVILMLGVGSSYATPGWAGLQWPPTGSSFLPTDDITMYVQIWDDPCTPPAGQCLDFDQVWIDYRKATDPTFTSVLMTWNSFHVSSNDEYMYTITAAETDPSVNMICQARIHDITDDSWTTFGWEYVILAGGTAQEVTVTFRADMNSSCVDYSGGVNFVGSLTGWNMCQIGTEMTDPNLDGIYEGTWVFPAGSSTYYEYKFQRKDAMGNCHWSSNNNIPFTLSDASPTQVLDIQAYAHDGNWGPTEINAAGSFCAGLGCDENWIRLNTVYGVPTISTLSYMPGCVPAESGCDNEYCEMGSGEVVWDVRQGGDLNYYLVMALTGPNAYSGCFCITIDEILPVELVGFDAIAGDNEVTLSWSTASETDNDYFSIKRDGEEMARMDASGSATGHEYLWTDSDARNGVTYEYTLTNVDVDGSQQVIATESATPSRNNSSVTEYSLAQNYPNPFNPSTSIAFSLEEAGLVNITVYDVTGRLVATLVNGVHEAGSHSVEFNAAGLPSGIYMYRMVAGDFSAVQKMVLMK
jgi:hypothetical protein